MEAKLRLMKNSLQQAGELGAEEPTQHFHREKELPAAPNPTRIVVRDSAPRDNAMEVRMMVKVLSPGMQHGQKADAGAQMFWIGGNLQQGLGGGLEQEAVKHPLVL
jgi:hypothetical protein